MRKSFALWGALVLLAGCLSPSHHSPPPVAPLPVPLIPTNVPLRIRLKAAAVPSVTLGWDKSADLAVISYYLYWGTNSNTYTHSISVPAISNTVVISPLTAQTKYYFAATSVNSSGLESAFSNEVNYTPGATAAPKTNWNLVVQPVAGTSVTGPFTNYGPPLAVLSNTMALPPDLFFKLLVSKTNY